MIVSTMNSILCRRRLAVYFISSFLFCLLYVNGDESACQLQYIENCTNAIVVTIDEKSAKKEKSFSLQYNTAGKKKLVAVLYYDKSYICRPTKSYTCTNTTDVTFNINLGCETLQNVLLVGDGQQPVTCIPMENSSVESTNNNNHNCSHCANDTAPANSVYHSRQKRCACPNGSSEPSADIKKPDDTGGERGNTEGNVPIGLITGLTVPLILAPAAVLYLRRYIFEKRGREIKAIVKKYNKAASRKSIMCFTRKGYSPKYPHQDNEDL